MGFLHPELLLLALPTGYLWWRFRGHERGTRILRALVAAALVCAVAGPFLRTGEDGRDLVIVVDRSKSMPAGATAQALETIRLAEDARHSGDRVAVLGFGAEVGIETPPSASGRFAGFTRQLDGDGSDVAQALETALALISPERHGSILLLSDGESNGRDPLATARTAFARGVRIDTVPVLHAVGPDVALERLDLPEEVGAGEPFQFHAWVRSDEAREVAFVLERDGEVLAQGRQSLAPGANRLSFRDLLGRAGVAQYRLRLLENGDARPENDGGLGAVRVVGQRAVLVVNDEGVEDTLVLALRRAAIPVEVVAPGSPRLERLALQSARAVVLENVAAHRLGKALGSLREFVLERGGGLLMTGGRASFGLGGYYLSPLDEVLPVSLEMRQEMRKLGVAMAIALDRSGSMAVPTPKGVPKMQLANLGTCAAIELLAPIDSVGVIAVDSSPHTVQPLVPVQDVFAITSRVRRIESSGGGIFCYSALLAAGKMLEGAAQKNRHVILFADAADSEEQEGCPELIERYRELGITLSVVALGTDKDPDAEFLKRCAEQGGGTCAFTNDAEELPRLFAQDTLTMARATFSEDPVSCTPLPDLLGLGEALAGLRSFPPLAGHNVTWLRPDAACGVVTSSEFRSPAFAFAQAGLGRAAAFMGQIGGTHGAELLAWDGFASFFVTVVRWLAGQEEPAELFASVRREGREARIRVELDPRAPTPPDTSKLEVRLTGADGATTRLPLERVGEHLFEARTPLAREGIVLGSVDVGDGRTLSLPPLALPYSPEFERDAAPGRGEALLRQLARESGGEVAPPLATVLRGEREASAWRSVTRELALAALGLLLLEIALRRLQLWGTLASLFRHERERRREAPLTSARPAPATPVRRPSAPSPAPPDGAPHNQPATPTPALSLDEALARARRAANRELER